MVHMPSLEIWEWSLKIFCGMPTLTTHVDHLLYSHNTNKQTQSSKPCTLEVFNKENSSSRHTRSCKIQLCTMTSTCSNIMFR